MQWAASSRQAGLSEFILGRLRWALDHQAG
jgi:hypothetical protein